ncbi:protein singed wings 2 [Anabrus simplex]|uniref:protein singed wings 2 n=1 Tax=Anabrus simplex TaxID=316456 RepID=UPI0034DD0603
MHSHLFLLLWVVVLLRPLLAGRLCTPGQPCCQLRRRTHLMCSEGLEDKFTSGEHKIRALTLHRWPSPTFDPAVVLSPFPLIQRLTLTDSNVTHLQSDFSVNSRHLEVLNISGLMLESLADSTFLRMKELQILDLRDNNISELDLSALEHLPSLREIYLSGNPWKCDNDLTWLIDDSHNRSVANRVVDRDKMECIDEAYKGKPVVPVMGFIKALEEECPREPPNNCTCWINNIVWSENREYMVPFIFVNCSNLGLVELPPTLPTNTATVLLKGNKISDLQPLVTNEYYSRVLDLHLDDNLIKSIAVLEGANWLLRFRFFSLRRNLLTHLPTHALDNALERNHNAVSILLGSNPWHCDCQFTPSFQDLLVKYIKLVRDISDVKCSFEEGSENSLARVRDISRSSLCRDHSHVVQPLDLLNGFLAFLIVFILGKLAYDYWAFKRTGKLPWIVSKMP